MIEIYRIPVSKERLSALPEDERVLLLLLGYVSNQVSMIQKLITFATNRMPSEEVEQHSTGVQTQMLVRIAAGMMSEAWSLVTKRFIKNKQISNAYIPLLDQRGKQAFDDLKLKFGQSGLLFNLRNDFCFHYPDDKDVNSAFEVACSDHDSDSLWSAYLSHHGFNSIFLFSDIIFVYGMGNAAKQQSVSLAHEKIMGEIATASINLVEFSRAFFIAIWKQHFGDEIIAKDVVQIIDAPKVDDVWIPFFVEMPPPTP